MNLGDLAGSTRLDDELTCSREESSIDRRVSVDKMPQ